MQVDERAQLSPLSGHTMAGHALRGAEWTLSAAGGQLRDVTQTFVSIRLSIEGGFPRVRL